MTLIKNKVMITEAYVSFEVAKLLKEKGFDEHCIYVYLHNGDTDIWDADKEDIECTKPTLQMAMKWLREAHNIHIIARPYTDKEGQHWGFIFDKYAYGCWQELAIYITDSWDSYEEAVEVAIKYCLEKLI